MYALKKLWLRMSLGRGPRLPPQLAHHVRVRMDMVLLAPQLKATAGLCAQLQIGHPQLRGNSSTVLIWLRHQFKLWPHNSGCATFPVPHRTLDPVTAYCKENMWAGEYGAMRLNLAKHLLAAAERDMGIKP
jgi:hypothetical protein